MKILIAFYSWQGHTETLARALSEKTGGPVVRIEPLVDPGKKIGRKGLKALLGMREEIEPVRADLTEVDHLVIATPVWAHNLPPYTRQYLSGLSHCTGKKFSVLAEMGASGGEKVVQKVRKILERKGMKFVASVVTVEKDVDEKMFENTLDEFARKIQADST
ncbi:MAG: NAD(P)H-dependent oxidoreductase [Methanolinea sp.]|nr:NAD(P)H-dependent oxidoreductase [Methanolinea sp.]